MKRWISALSVAAILTTTPASTQQTRFRPDPKKCMAYQAVSLPGFAPNDSAPPERFDFAYATKSDGTLEVDLQSKVNGGSLKFIGVEHVISPNPKLFSYLELTISQLKPTEAYVEVADVTYLDHLPKDKEAVIQTRGEPSYLGFIAKASDIPVRPLELTSSALTSRLTKHLLPEKVFITFVLRDAQILRDRKHLSGEQLEAAVRNSITEHNKLMASSKARSQIKNVLQLTQAVNRYWPKLDWRQVPAEWFNPLLNDVDTGGLFTNSIVYEEMRIRDEYSLDLLLREVEKGKRIIALAGRTHAETHLQTLTCLMSRH